MLWGRARNAAGIAIDATPHEFSSYAKVRRAKHRHRAPSIHPQLSASATPQGAETGTR
jgi:hypothetical protein